MKVSPAKIYFSEEDKREILQKIEESLSTGQLTLGKNGKEFEERFAELEQDDFSGHFSQSFYQELGRNIQAYKPLIEDLLLPLPDAPSRRASLQFSCHHSQLAASLQIPIA